MTTDNLAARDRVETAGLSIAILVPRLSEGGAEFVAVEWARHLLDHGHRVQMITTHATPDDAAPLPTVALTASSFPTRVASLRSHLDDAGYDVLLALMPHWNVLALAATATLPHPPAVLISGRNVESTLRTVQGPMYRAELALSRALYRRASGYIAISHPVAAEAVSRYRLPISSVWVVPNPATGKIVAAAVGSSTRTASRDSVTLTVPARLVRQKRPELAVETAALLRSDYGIDVRVEFFGTGPEQDAVLATARRLGVEVGLRGWVDRWFDAAAPDAVVLLTSLAEGFANVLVEAAAVGIPSVVSSRALGSADAVVPRLTGIMAMGDSAAAYAAAVVEAMPLTPVRAPGWLAGFSREASGRKLLEVIDAVVPRPQHDAPILGRAVATQPLTAAAEARR